jgi:hypothetical protein
MCCGVAVLAVAGSSSDTSGLERGACMVAKIGGSSGKLVGGGYGSFATVIEDYGCEGTDEVVSIDRRFGDNCKCSTLGWGGVVQPGLSVLELGQLSFPPVVGTTLYICQIG